MLNEKEKSSSIKFNIQKNYKFNFVNKEERLILNNYQNTISIIGSMRKYLLFTEDSNDTNLHTSSSRARII